MSDDSQNRALLQDALHYDRSGNLDRARDSIRTHNFAGRGHLVDLVEGFRVEAKVLRHRHEPESLRQAADVARWALELTRLPAWEDETGAALAELEWVSCRLAADDFVDGARAAAQWTGNAHPAVSGWAWALVGEADLGLGKHFEAIAAQHNAIAEYRRVGNAFRERAARIALAAALSRAGHVTQANSQLAADKEYWAAEPEARRRTSIAYLIVLAENEQRAGRIGAALEATERARASLKDCTGMRVAEVHIERRRAACLAEWRQVKAAQRAMDNAKRALDAIQPAAARVGGADEPPIPPPTRQLTGKERALQLREHSRLIADTRSVGAEAGIGSSVRGGSRATVEKDGVAEALDVVEGMATHAKHTALNAAAVRVLIDTVETIQGKAGLERVEAAALVKAGEILVRANQNHPDEAERLLRRAQVRLEQLDGVGLLHARCKVALAGALHALKQPQAALDLGLEGLRGLDAERLHMHERSFRRQWLSAAVDMPFDEVISLALETGNHELAADLIVYSRVAGVVVPQLADGTGAVIADVPIAAVPTFSYIDGSVSKVTGVGEVRFE